MSDGVDKSTYYLEIRQVQCCQLAYSIDTTALIITSVTTKIIIIQNSLEITAWPIRQHLQLLIYTYMIFQ